MSDLASTHSPQKVLDPQFIRNQLASTETVKLRISEAEKSYVTTETFKLTQKKLEECSHVTICGGQGEGKTTMALMLASGYIKKGYEAVLVDKVGLFDFDECIASSHRCVFILDDISETVGMSSSVKHLNNVINSINFHIRDCKLEPKKTVLGKQSPENTRQNQQDGHIHITDIRVVFTSKTCNFEDVHSKLPHHKDRMFSRDTVVDLTADKEYRYSDREKMAIFEKFKNLHPTGSADELSEEDILKMDTSQLGFPLTCRLYFELGAFTIIARDFFKRPLLYLRIELHDLLSLKNHQSAALILMILCDNKLDVSRLNVPGRDQTMDEMVGHVTDLLPFVTRQEIATAVQYFRGTYFCGGYILSFSHSSLYQACAHVLYSTDPKFVFEKCTLQCIYEKLRPGPCEDNSDHCQYLFVSDTDYPLVATRFVDEMKQGKFSKTVTHPLLSNKHFVQLLFDKLQSISVVSTGDEHWIKQRDNGRGFFYWAVQGHCSKLPEEIENIVNIRFTQTELSEALDACVESDNLTLLKAFSLKLEKCYLSKALNRLILLAAKTATWDVVHYLLMEGADVRTIDKNLQNVIHIVCTFGRSNVLRNFVSQIDSLIGRQDYLCAVNSVDLQGRTPAMIAGLYGYWDCFTLLSEDSQLDIEDYNGDCVIHSAAWIGNRDIVQHVLTPSNVNSKGMHGWTPVMNAAANGHQAVFDLLVSHKADLTLVDDYGDTVLHLACQGGDVDVVQHVMKLSDVNIKGKFGRTPVMNAAFYGHLNVFEFLVSSKADVTMFDDRVDSLLHLACSGGNTDIVQHLMRPSNVNSKGLHSWTPAMKTAVAGHSHIFDLLVSHNADLTVVDDYGSSLLYLASRGGSTDIVQHVLTPSNINKRGTYGWTPIMIAAFCGQQSVFELLVSNDADLTLVDDFSEGLVHLSCYGGNRNIVNQVLAPSNIDMRGEDEWTPVMASASGGHLDLFEFLVSKGADLSLVDVNGDSLLHVACRGGNPGIVQHLLTPSNINMRGDNGRTPIMVAALYEHVSLFSLLKRYKADLTLVDDLGDSLLHVACLSGNKRIVQRVLTPSNIDSKGEYGWTPVMVAAAEGHSGLFEFLMSQKADLTPVDLEGDSLIHLACKGGNKSIVQYALTVCNIDSRGQNGWTPVMWAGRCGHKEILDLLVEHQADLTLVDKDGRDVVQIAQDEGKTDVADYLKTFIK